MVKEKICSLCKQHNVIPLYITKFGSYLYGTNTVTSDKDYKVIYLPSLYDMMTNKWERSFSYKTNTKKDTRNSNFDIDVEFKSIQQFFYELKKGDTGALDVAYSYTNNYAVLFMDDIMQDFFNNVYRCYDITNLKAYLGYAQSQALKYSNKGERIYVLKKCTRWLLEHPEYKEHRINDFYKQFLNDCGVNNLCFLSDNRMYICILGTKYMITNRYEYLLERLMNSVYKYGERANNVYEKFKTGEPSADWKALSHAYRCVVQLNELLDSGIIKFPLQKSSELIDIKTGKIDIDTVMNKVSDGIKEVENKMKNVSNKLDEDYMNTFIVKIYERFYNINGIKTA